MSPAHFGAFLLESVVWYTVLVQNSEVVRYSGQKMYIASMGIAVGTSTVVHYTAEEVCY